MMHSFQSMPHSRPSTCYARALLLAALWLGLAPASGYAATFVSIASGNWNNTGTWTIAAGTDADGVPDGDDSVTINNNYTVTVNGSFSANAVTIDFSGNNNTTSRLAVGSGALTINNALTLNGGTGNRNSEVSISTGTLTVGGNIVPNGATALVTFTGAGTLNVGGSFGNGAGYTAGTGTVVYNGAGAQSVGAYNYYNLTVNKLGTATLAGNVTLGSNLTVSSGTLSLGGNTADRNTAGGTLTLADGATLEIASGNFPANYTTESIGVTSTVNYNAAFNITVPAKGYGNLTLSNSGNRSLPTMTVAGNFVTVNTVAAIADGNLTVNGQMSIGAGTSFSAGTFSHSVKGNFSNNGTFIRDTSTFTFNGTAAQTITGATSFYHFVSNNSAGVSAVSNLSIGGNFTNTAGFNAGTTTTTFNGVVAQNLTGVTTFHNLTMSNAAGLTLNNNVTVNNILSFTNGKITTGVTTPPTPYPNTLTTTAACASSVSGAGAATGWVIGNLRKSIPAGASTCTFEVGAGNYSHVTLVFPAGTASGSLTGAVMPHSNGHPNIAGTDIDPTQGVNLFWTLKDNTVSFSSFEATFNFNAADIDSTDPLDFVIRRYSPPYPAAGSWSSVTLDTAETTYTRGIGITGVGDFVVGKSTIAAFLREPEWVYQRELYYQ